MDPNEFVTNIQMI